jgi:zinc protease
MHAKRLLLALFVLVLGLLVAGAAGAAAPQRHRLPSGLTVLTAENHEAPVAAFQVWVRAGSAFERAGEYGITHLIEHMIFKGTPEDPEGEMAKRIEGLGGEVNAYTTYDHTNYFVSAASRYAPQVLGLLADAVVNAAFDPTELSREQEVVVEEIRMNLDDPRRQLAWKVMEATFGADHPYGRPVIGSMESVRGITRQKILDYRSRWYTAPNMMVVAVGDFDTAEVLALVEKAFAGLPEEPAPELDLPPVETPPGPRLVVLRDRVRQAHLAATWRIPGLPDPAVYPMDMAAQVLGGGEASRLPRSLKEERGLVDSADAYAYTPRGVGMFEVSAQAAPQAVEKAWGPLLRETLSLIRRPPRGEELQRARVQLSAEFVRDRQTMAAQARMLGYFEMFRGGFEKLDQYLARFKATGAAEVARAAHRYFTPERLVLVLQLPEGAAAPDEAGLEEVAARAFTELRPPAGDGEQAVESRVGGLTLVVQPRRALPLVAYTLAAPGGQEDEAPGQAGLYQLWSRALTRGAGGLSHRELTTELENMAARLEGFAGKSTCGLAGSFLAEDWRRGLELLATVWREPEFPAGQVEKARDEQLAGLRQQQNSPVSRAFIAFRKLLYGDHPYAHNPLGRPETVRGFTREDLLAAHARVEGPAGAVLTVVGDVDPAEVHQAVAGLLGGKQGRVEAPQVAEVARPAGPRSQSVEAPQAQQTQIAVGFVTPPAADPASRPLHLIQAILGGQGGRLFSDLRDRRSLAYAVQPFYNASRHGGGFGVYMAVGPDKRGAALEGLYEHLERIRSRPPSAEELERAKQYLVGVQAIDLQEYGSLAMSMAMNHLMGLGYDYHRRFPELVRGVEAREVQETAARVLAAQGRVQLTLGPQ